MHDRGLYLSMECLIGLANEIGVREYRTIRGPLVSDLGALPSTCSIRSRE